MYECTSGGHVYVSTYVSIYTYTDVRVEVMCIYSYTYNGASSPRSPSSRCLALSVCWGRAVG